MGKTFEYRVKILERHLDAFGHVNNATYLELFEEARWDFITANGFGLQEVQTTHKGPVILDLQLSFKRELFNRQEILITSQFTGMKSRLVMNLHQKIIQQEGAKLASEIDLSLGLMDLKARKLMEPTPEWLKAVGVEEHS